MTANSPTAARQKSSIARSAIHAAAGTLRHVWLILLLIAGSAEADPSPPPPTVPRTLHVVSDNNFPPMIFIGPDGQAEGYLVDLWKLWEQKTGITVRLSALNWAEAQRMALSGEADVIDAIYRTAAREKLYEFSPAYAELPVAIFTHHTIGGIHELASLRGFQVAVQEGDACIDILLRNGVTNLTRYRNYAELLEAAMKDEVKIFCMDEYPAHYYLYRLKADQVFLKAFELYRGEVHRAVRKGQQATLEVVERGMALITDAERAELQRKWLKTADDSAEYLRLLGLLVAVMLVIGAVLLAWVLTLRSAVRQKTAALEQEKALLHESEQRFRKLFEETRQPIALLENGRLVYANQATLAMLHLQSQEQLLGLSPVELSPPLQPDGRPSAEKAAEMLVQALETGMVFEWEHVRPDGTPFTAQIMLTPIRLGGQDLIHLVWNDISAQKQIERELAEHRQHLEQLVAERTAELSAMAATLHSTIAQQDAILDSASSGIVLLQDRIAIRCNRRLHDMLGWPDGSLVGQSTRGWYPSDESFMLAGSEAYGILERGLTHRREQLLRRRDGTTVWTRMTGQAIKADDPSQGSVWIIDDISAEREAAQALQQAIDKQRAIFDAAPVGLVYLTEGRMEAMNQHLIALLGYQLKEIPTLDAWWSLAYPDPEYRQQVIASWDAALTRTADRNGKIEPQEYRVTRKDGTELTLLIGGQLMDDGMITTFTDVTLFKQAELAMRQARDAAEEAARIKADFLANMSHEIRTPMNAVMGMTTLALQADPPPRVRDYLQKIQLSSRHLLGIINDILDFSKMEAHRLKLEQVEFSLQGMLGDVTTLCMDKALAKGLEFVVDVAPDVPPALIGDPLRLGQVLINLSNNAIKFTAQGKVTIEVSVLARPADTVQLCFKVSDTGIGIAGEHRQNLFQSFQQADTSTTRRFGGTGLGLAISKRIVELMGGEIGVDSTPGLGSTFWFSVQLKTAAQPSRLPAPTPDAVGTPATDHAAADMLVGAQALLVEDNELNQEVASAFLTELGLQVDLAADGAIALQKVQGRAYDVVLMDMQMPVLDGLSATREIRKLPGLQTLPILAMTANAMATDRESCLAAGMNDHIAKPIDFEELRTKLLRWVRPAPRTGQPATIAPAAPAADPAQRHALKTQLKQLRQLLHANDFACMRLWSEHEPEFRAALGEDFPAIARAISDCDFEGALTALERGLGRWSSTEQ